MSEPSRQRQTAAPAPGLTGHNFLVFGACYNQVDRLLLQALKKTPWCFLPHSYNAITVFILSLLKNNLTREQLPAESCCLQRRGATWQAGLLGSTG